MTVARFSRLKVGSGLTGTDLGGDVLELAAAPVAPPRRLLAQLQGPLPVSPESSGMYRIPYALGTSVEYTLQYSALWLEEDGSTSTTVVIEKSPSAEVFTATAITTLTCSSGVHLAEDDTGLGTLESGDLLRFRWSAIGTGADNFHVILEGEES